MKKILYYIHDPMCSWCWGFRPAWEKMKATLAAIDPDLHIHCVLGGLAPDSDAPMPLETQHYIKQNWRRIQEVIPGTVFNNDFWNVCHPRRSTYPACRAVIAAIQQGVDGDVMTLAIQQAYYLQAKNPSDDDVLCACADQLGLNVAVFSQAIRSEQTQQILEENMACYQVLQQRAGIAGFPSLALQLGDKIQAVPIDYNNPDISLDFIRLAL